MGKTHFDSMRIWISAWNLSKFMGASAELSSVCRNPLKDSSYVVKLFSTDPLTMMRSFDKA